MTDGRTEYLDRMGGVNHYTLIKRLKVSISAKIRDSDLIYTIQAIQDIPIKTLEKAVAALSTRDFNGSMPSEAEIRRECKALSQKPKKLNEKRLRVSSKAEFLEKFGPSNPFEMARKRALLKPCDFEEQFIKIW